MNHRPQLLTIAALFALSGCGHNVDPNRLPKTPKYPTPPPQKIDMPIDPKLNQSARAVLSEMFASNDPVLRANAVEATQRSLGIVGQERILAALNDSSSIVCFAGAMAAGQVPVPAAAGRLHELTDNRDVSIRIGSRFALHMLGDKSLTHDFETYVQDPRPWLRGYAVTALGLMKEPSAIKLLRTLLPRETDPGVRLQILEARYRLGDDDAFKELIVGTVSAYPDDQIVSILALASTHDAKNTKTFLGQLTSDYPEVCLTAARALGEVGSDEGMAVALDGAKVKDPRQRALAALALGDIGRTDAQPALRKLLIDEDPSVRLAAATAVLQLKN